LNLPLDSIRALQFSGSSHLAVRNQTVHANPVTSQKSGKQLNSTDESLSVSSVNPVCTASPAPIDLDSGGPKLITTSLGIFALGGMVSEE
jgi:hypothetical protein